MTFIDTSKLPVIERLPGWRGREGELDITIGGVSQRSGPGLTPIKLSALAVFTLACGAAPKVEKVELPNWRTPHTYNPIEVLLAGSELKGAAVNSANRAYLFVYRYRPQRCRRSPTVLPMATRPTTARRGSDAAVVFDWMRRLLHFLRAHPALRRGRLVQFFATDQYAYLRSAPRLNPYWWCSISRPGT
jgi:hypothetical protein